MTESLVQARGLTKRFGDFTAVDAIDFDIHPGEAFGFLGPNGAGKSTTIKILCTLAAPTAGTATVMGYDVVRERDEVRSNIGLVFQETTLDDYLSAHRNLLFHGELYNVDRSVLPDRIEQVMRMVGLWDRKDHDVSTFSGGMKRRLEIARGLVHAPNVLFLDEPTIGLDVTMQKRIRSFVAEYNRRHRATVLLTSHYMADVEALCRRVIVIHHGRILYDGPLTGLADQFAAYKTIGVALENGQVDLDRYGEVIHREGDWITLRVPKAETSQVAARLLADQSVLDLTIEDPPIEDVIELVFAQERAE